MAVSPQSKAGWIKAGTKNLAMGRAGGQKLNVHGTHSVTTDMLPTPGKVGVTYKPGLNIANVKPSLVKPGIKKMKKVC